MKIGLLFPQSELFPAIRRDLMLGLSIAQKKDPFTQWEIVPEFIGAGALAQVESAINKCKYQHDCDMVIAWVNTKVMLSLQPIIAQLQMPLIVLNVGEHLSSPEWRQPYLFFHTAELWRSQMVLAEWMQMTFGGDCCINTSLFDSGYGLLEAYKLGLGRAGGTQLHLNVLKNPPGDFQTASLFDSLAAMQTVHVHALLSGGESVDFLQQYDAKTQEHSPPLSVSPFMLEEPIPASCSMQEAYTASTWQLNKTGNEESLAFWLHQQPDVPNVFQLLSYEVGLVLVETSKTFSNSLALQNALATTIVQGPRGIISLTQLPHEKSSPVLLEKIRIDVGNISRESIDEIVIDSSSDAHLFSSAKQAVTGWHNPYLFL
ncbi:hypothetical protein [Phnomibacter sp. MR]|uniref:hypothetical protein n=1 Tax=Phnomibacter sp. MR TaxID=3042318 RepID=UPI003A812569